MGIDTIENVYNLLAVVLGALYALFKYIKTPKRGWLFISVFFLAHLLSDYYWTTYTLVIGEDPNVSELMAYFGWNIGYLFLFLLTIDMRPKESKGFFHPIILVPIPLGIWQFFIYIRFGGIFNNIWEGFFAICISCICVQVISHYFKNRDNFKEIPWLHLTILCFIIFEYGMWTSSCFDWGSELVNPYHYFSLLECLSLIFLNPSANKCYEQRGTARQERTVQETHFTILLQITVTVIIFFGGVGGYYIGVYMKHRLSSSADNPDVYSSIAITLFIISIILVAFILMIILMTAIRYKSLENDFQEGASIKRGRFNFIMTIAITFCLMITSVLYTARLFYQVSVTGAMEDGQAKVYSTAEDFENYLGVARSILWVTADTVDIMLHNGDSQDIIRDYIYKQTENQSEQFDENFTGLYAYINGEYMDGSGWVPPPDYNVENRDWYKNAVNAEGKTIIVSPYVDAQTGSVVITICKLLSDGGRKGDYSNREVVALDMVVNHVTTTIQDVNIAGKGYGFVVDHDGMIIAHHDSSLNGRDIDEIYGEGFLKTLTNNKNATSKVYISGEAYTLFIEPVISQWYVVIAISDKELFEETYRQLSFNIIVSLIIFLMISFFYYLGYKNEQLNARKMEELRSTNMRRDYEAQILKQKEVAANEANKAKSQFLAQMSHEIRTPINAILGMNEMILRSSDDNDILDYSKGIDSAGNTLLALINTILDFSKIEDGKMDIIPVNYDTASLINDLLNSISRRADEKGLELISDIDKTLPRTLFGDDVRIKQVIMNLLTNAVKYTEKGYVRLTVRADSMNSDKINLYVSVQDTGIGIRSEDISRLTLSFQRLDEKKNRNIEGTGLGMSIVSNLLTLMGSKICVKSTYGEGSLFYFTIEQKITDRTPIGAFTQNPSSNNGERSDSDLINAPYAQVLVVDDNSLNLTVATNLLKLCHIKPDSVTSGAEAISAMSDKIYDIVFLDHMMPKMDGIETLQKLRELDLIPESTKIVVLTANAIVGAREKYLSEGFDDYLSKPIGINALVSILTKYLPECAYETEETTNLSEFEITDDMPIETNNILIYDIMKLKLAGIDTDSAIEYCGDSSEAYFDTLNYFTQDFDSKRDQLTLLYDNQNWKEYNILIHAIKGNLRILGITDLAAKALSLEKASKRENLDVNYITSHHTSFINEYRLIKEAICAAKL